MEWPKQNFSFHYQNIFKQKVMRIKKEISARDRFKANTDLKLISQSWNKKKCRPDGYRNGYGDLVGKRADENI